MKTKYVFFFLLASSLLYSCEDFFDSVTTVDIAPHESKLAVFGYMDADNPIQTISVGNSKGYTESGSPDVITTATAALSKNGITVGTFSPSGSGEYYLNGTLEIETGDELRLDVSVTGYEPVYAVEIVPPVIDVQNISYEGEAFSQEYGEALPEYEIVINDDANFDNFYSIEAWRLDTINNYKYKVYIYSNDFNMEEWLYFGRVMSDESFNGNQYKARVFIEEYEPLRENEVYEFIIKSTSESMYKYAKSYTNYVNNDGNPFAEPVTVTSNIQEEGFGIFTYLRSQQYIVE